MPIIDGAYVAPTWNNNASPAIDATELQAMSDTIEGNQGKAPQSHASPNTTYGVGNASNYGHLKLSDTPSNAQGATSGVAASPKAVQTAVTAASSALAAANAALNAANAKARTAAQGSYIGIGTSGVNNKNSINFSLSGVPAVIFILAGNTSPLTDTAILFPNSGNGQNTYAHTNLTVSVSGTTVYWYATTNAQNQLNENGVTYYYVALY